MLKIYIFLICLKGFGLANPFLGLFDPKCVVIRDIECPNEKVTFWLYNRQTQDSPVKLDPLNLQPSDFHPRKPLYIILHGYTGHRDYSPNPFIRPALLKAEDVSVISVDYSALVPNPCYFAAVRNLPLASRCLANLINTMVDQGVVPNENIHMIGFSLGAQMAGQTANYLKRRLKRITGLDPAKPMFITVGSDRKLDPTDAEFVDVIHTDVLGRGMLRPMGHVDFYPNIGPYQPGCQEQNMEGFGLANPFLGLFDPKCVVIRDIECPNEKVTFWLYNRQTQDSPVKLDPLNLQPSDFHPRKPLYIILHGYTGHRDYSPNPFIRPALLKAEDVSVISVDYSALVPNPCYFAAVRNLPLASRCLANLINTMVDQGVVPNENIHMIGFSLGAQMAGQTANYLKRRLKRITGLDPAKPMFITVGSDRKLDPTDAEFVDVIHTDVLGRGMLRPMGHVDFYPNIGPYQPGCQEQNMEDPSSCNHDRAAQYYAESIRSDNEFWSYRCPSWLHNIFGLCNTQSNDEIMGFHVNQKASGSYFLKTSHQTPFALGPFTQKFQTRTQKLPSHYDFKDINDDEFEPQLWKAFVE